jgi:hypothetical protein
MRIMRSHSFDNTLTTSAIRIARSARQIARTEIKPPTKWKFMRRLAKLTSIAFAVVFLGIQLFSISITAKTPATSDAHMSQVINPQVGAILDRSCQDCHSNHTTWPWYSRVAPMSWMVSKHVREGREVLDFSEWTNRPPAADERMLICDAVSDGQMPLREYTMIHRKAKLSKQDVALICDWAAATDAPTALPPISKSRNQKE